jgi:hypothetical protein
MRAVSSMPTSPQAFPFRCGLDAIALTRGPCSARTKQGQAIEKIDLDSPIALRDRAILEF